MIAFLIIGLLCIVSVEIHGHHEQRVIKCKQLGELVRFRVHFYKYARN